MGGFATIHSQPSPLSISFDILMPKMLWDARSVSQPIHCKKNGVLSKHRGVKFLCVMQTPKCFHNTPLSR